MPNHEAAAAETGLRPPITRLEYEAFLQRLVDHPDEPVTEIPGVDPAETWEAAKEVEEGKLTSLEEVFANLRRRP